MHAYATTRDLGTAHGLAAEPGRLGVASEPMRYSATYYNVILTRLCWLGFRVQRAALESLVGVYMAVSQETNGMDIDKNKSKSQRSRARSVLPAYIYAYIIFLDKRTRKAHRQRYVEDRCLCLEKSQQTA